MLNIDKPLDEIIKESRQQKREKAKERRQKEREARDAKREKNAKKDDSPKDLDTPSKETPKARGGIRKKRRSRGGDKGKNVDGEVVRKNDRKDSANGSGDTKQNNDSGSRKPNKGAKVSVFNLDHGVTQSDISELFETVGPLRSARLIVLHDGRSSGSAEVVFENMSHALEAIRRYNNVPLDNRPLKITLSTDSAPIRVSRGRRGGRKLVVDGNGGASFGRRNSDGAGFGRRSGGGSGNNSADESPRGNFRDRGDSDATPTNNNSKRFNDDDDMDRFNDNDRFGDNDRGYSRRNNRRNRRSYDRRGGSSPNGNQNYMD